MAYTDEQLRALCNTVETSRPAWVDEWRRGAAAFIREVAQTPPELRATREFQRKLWESEAITSTGMGSVTHLAERIQMTWNDSIGCSSGVVQCIYRRATKP